MICIKLSSDGMGGRKWQAYNVRTSCRENRPVDEKVEMQGHTDCKVTLQA